MTFERGKFYTFIFANTLHTVVCVAEEGEELNLHNVVAVHIGPESPGKLLTKADMPEGFTRNPDGEMTETKDGEPAVTLGTKAYYPDDDRAVLFIVEGNVAVGQFVAGLWGDMMATVQEVKA